MGVPELNESIILRFEITGTLTTLLERGEERRGDRGEERRREERVKL